MEDLSVVTRLTGFLAILAVVFVAAYAAGTAFGPLGEPSPPAHSPSHTEH